ncbi:MAG TPA: GNAT family N-acetyltransferase [Rhodothermales bacterium]
MLTLDRAVAADADEIKQVLSETWVATYAANLSPETIALVTTQWHDPELLRDQIEKPGDYFAVAKEEGRIVALISVAATSPEELHLTRLYVLPECQGTGIGSRLLDAALACYPGARVIRLEVERQNAAGHAFWLRRGFVGTGTSVIEVGPDRIAVVTMERTLA